MELQSLPLKINGQAIEPISDNYWDLGGTRQFRNIKFKTAIYGGSVVGDWNASTDNTYSLGTATGPVRWLNGYFSNIVNIGVVDATDTTPLQVRVSSAGTLSPLAGTAFLIESNASVYSSIITNGNECGVVFGNVSDVDSVQLIARFDTPVNAQLYVAGVLQYKYSDGALAFQKATTISTSTGVLTLTATDNAIAFNATGDIVFWNNATGTSRNVTFRGTTATDGQANDSPTLRLVAKYDADPSASVTSTDWMYSIAHDMITAGAAPKSQAIHSINSVPILTLENNNATPAVIFGAGNVYINDTSNANMTLGLTINQGANDDEILALKSSDVAHGCTLATETDTYAQFKKYSPDGGGLAIRAFGDANITSAAVLVLAGAGAVNVDTAKSTAGRASVEVHARQISGTDYSDIVADGNVFGIRARVSGADATVALIDEDGDLWLNGGITTGNDINIANLYSIVVGSTTTGENIGFKAQDVSVGKVFIGGLVNANDPFFYIGRNDTGVATNAVTDMLVLQAGAGTTNVAAGFGYGISVKLSNDAHEVEERASLDFVVTTATNGAESARLAINLMSAGSMTTPFTFYHDNFILTTQMSLSSGLADDNYFTIKARDNGVGLVEVARVAGAADPYFSMGGSQQHKFTNAGLVGFFGATPVSQQLKASHNNWAALSDVVSALVNLGLLDAA